MTAYDSSRRIMRIGELRSQSRLFIEKIDLQSAESALREAVELAKPGGSVDDNLLWAKTMEDLASLLYRASRRNLAEVYDLYQASLMLHEGTNRANRSDIALLYEKLSAVHDTARRPLDAADCLVRALKIWEASPDQSLASPARLDDLRQRANYFYRAGGANKTANLI